MATIDPRPTPIELLEPVMADTIDHDDKSSYHHATLEAFSEAEKLTAIYMVSFVAMISPLASTIYYPALPSLAKHYHVSDAMIQLTITVYQPRLLLQFDQTLKNPADNTYRSSKASHHPS